MVKSHLSVILALTLCVVPMAHAQNLSPNEAKQIAERAYIYAYPLVVMETTGAAMPLHHLTHVAEFPDANFRLIVRPNADTLYSTAWLDVSKEPLLLHVPDSGGLLLSAAIHGCVDRDVRRSRKTNNWEPARRGTQSWDPAGVAAFGITSFRLDAPTNHVWLLGRTQTNGASDYDNVHIFQQGMCLVQLSEYPGKEAAQPPPMSMKHSTRVSPLDRVKAMQPAEFFRTFAQESSADMERTT